MEVQIFGVKKSPDTRKALRFFAERRIKTHFVDFAERSPSLGELRRFVQRFGVDGVIDRESREFVELGLLHARLSDERWLEKLMDQPAILRMPLVRQVGPGVGGLTIGLAEDEWRKWVDR